MRRGKCLAKEWVPSLFPYSVLYKRFVNFEFITGVVYSLLERVVFEQIRFISFLRVGR